MAAGRFHIILDLKEVSLGKLNDKEGLTSFLQKLPGLIGMEILHGPTVIEGVEKNPGITGFVIIDFSHISIHTFTESKTAMVDIFSCKSYSKEVAKKAVLDYFQISQENVRIKEVYWG